MTFWRDVIRETIPDLRSAFLDLQYQDQVGRCSLKDAEIPKKGKLELKHIITALEHRYID